MEPLSDIPFAGAESAFAGSKRVRPLRPDSNEMAFKEPVLTHPLFSIGLAECRPTVLCRAVIDRLLA